MKHNIFSLLIFSLFTVNAAFTQTTEQVSYGVSYTNQTFYDISSSKTMSVPNQSWDIAFTMNPFSAGVLINESVGRSGNPSVVYTDIKLFSTNARDFESASLQDTTGRLYNDEAAWANGAFNSVADPGDPFDFGWGIYNQSNNTVTGAKTYIIQLRDETYRKIQIQSMVDGKYSFRYADLDGQNEFTKVVDKRDYADNTLACFSIVDDLDFAIEPEAWDLVFMRYTRPVTFGSSDVLEYVVTGVLMNEGIEAVKASGIDQAGVSFDGYEAALTDSIDVIGHDWKELVGFSFEIVTDAAYFIKLRNNEVWKIYFDDFEGSSTGVTTLTKEFMGLLVSTSEPTARIPAFSVFPNPADDYTNVFLETNIAQAEKGLLQVHDLNGRLMYAKTLTLSGGFQQEEVSLNQLTPGQYIISIQMGAERVSSQIIKQ